MADEFKDDKAPAKPSKPFRFKASKSPLKEGRLAVGQAVSVAPADTDLHLLAMIRKTSADRLWLEVPRPVPEVRLKPGDRLHLKLWDYYEAVYCDSVVAAVSGVQGEQLEVSRPVDGEVLERKRAWAVYKEILFDLRVARAAQPALVGRQEEGQKTLKLEQEGFEFRTDLPLEAHDRLELQVSLPPEQTLTALAEVTLSQESKEEGKPGRLVHLRFVEMDAARENLLALFLAQTLPADSVDDVFWTG